MTGRKAGPTASRFINEQCPCFLGNLMGKEGI